MAVPDHRSWLRWLFDAARFYPLLLLFAVICLAWSLPAGLLFRLLPARIGQPLGRWGISRGFRLYLGVLRAFGMLRCDLSALDALRQERGLVIAPNHPSMMDAVLIASRLPRVACITKASVWNNPLLGGGVRLAGYVRNDATLPMIRNAAAMMRRGGQLMIFPEGTRSPPDAPLGPVTRSFALMAEAAGAPVQTVLIERGNPFLCKGWPAWRMPPLPLIYRVRLGRRFQPEGSAADLSRRVEHALREALAPEAEAEQGAAGCPRRNVA
ncbi:lysophospholipid acyltransferase family protein [Teichococcus oryzae]|uniref:1-acyl-sn-glycerol-3-phosphate acyltransferase n=1 Tax=Teichococcus oryzae TaxID=1608942 RepID=A0A5B2TF14_9PROT|nr:lysophospholipid acyltransferase family protein [Pseudoroseomonas oryzae]KAA2213047.1 1-acyl-sn-glycerol-3-phosphate acyltransferase [Pseudoroseomonas oryzae]